MDPLRISFIGAGRVAGALCRNLFNKGCKIDSIITRTITRGPDLAAICDAHWYSDLSREIKSDIIIVSVQDSHLQEVLNTLKCDDNTVVAHTAGSFGMEVFPPDLKHKGVLYPLQTFTEGRNIDFSSLPLLIEASDKHAATLIERTASLTGGSVSFSDAVTRRKLHVAAVFACNFTNHMFTISKKLAEEAGTDFDILKPLILETVSKAVENDPENSQTGPAVRGDVLTMEKHMELLRKYPGIEEIYSIISGSISKHHNSISDD